MNKEDLITLLFEVQTGHRSCQNAAKIIQKAIDKATVDVYFNKSTPWWLQDK